MRIRQRARFGQVFWCDFPADAPPEEFHAEHPAVVVKSANDLKDTCIVVPMTSLPNAVSPVIHKLRRNYNPARPDLDAWAVCNHLYTVSQSRLRPFQHKGQQVTPKMQDDDLDDVLACIRRALPQICSPRPAAVPESPAACGGGR